MHEGKPSPELVRNAEQATDAALRYWFGRGLTDEQIADRIGQEPDTVAEARVRMAQPLQDERSR